MALNDLQGRQFGRLTAVQIFEPAGRRGRKTTWLCECDCGGEAIVARGNLTNGHTRSCGCLNGADHRQTNMRPVLDRLAERSYTDLETRCTVWKGGYLHFGHGTVCVLGHKTLVHRAAWEAVNGRIPEGLNCLHRCDNPPCWNTDHLFLGTQADNCADRDAKGRNVVRYGEQHGMAFLTTEKVIAIRDDQRRTAEIAEEYGTCVSNVLAIKNRLTWRHVP